MTRKRLYLVFAVIGLAAPYYFFLSFMLAHGLDTRLFIEQLFGTPISAFFAVDLIVSSVVFLGFLRDESVRLTIPRPWLYVAALLAVGLSFALPLFLYIRESHLPVSPTRRTRAA